MKKPLAVLLLAATLWSSAAAAALPDAARFSVVMELGDVKQAQAWLDEGLDPDFEGTLIGTGLMIGAWEGNLPLMELFLARGADIHRINRFGETALMLAAWKNRKTALQWLLDHGARPNRGEREWTALHYASFAGHTELVAGLLAAGANVNARSTNGSTVIMMAAREGHGAVARQLLQAGANPALKNDFADDAVAWAMRQGNYDIAKALASAGNYAEQVRATVAKPLPKPVRSVPAPDAVEEFLRMARLAESQGNRGEALAAYRRALAELKAQQAPRKVDGDGTAKQGGATKTPTGLVIRAKRGNPALQSLAVAYQGSAAESTDSTGIDQLLEQARAAEASGNRAQALQLFRLVSARLKAGGQ